ncbi:MAG: hypothetical protein LBB23_02555 [Rickettsiales bacterium]|nr:hypothetical protein [Rickettsiales bacterium]
MTQKITPLLYDGARFYILTIISRLDSAICFWFFNFIGGKKDKCASICNSISEDKSDECAAIAKKCYSANGKELNSDSEIQYPFDVFGTNNFIEKLNNAMKSYNNEFAKFLSDKMIIAEIEKYCNLRKHLINIFLLRQVCEHPDKNNVRYSDVSKKVEKKFDLADSLYSLFLFLPREFMNHIIGLIKDDATKTNALTARKNANDANRKFRQNRNQIRQTGEKFHRMKSDAFIGVANLSVIKNMVKTEKKKELFGIPDFHECALMFDFVLGIQTIFRRYFCGFVNNEKSDYSKLRDMVAHSHIFLDKQAKPYISVLCEKVKLVLAFFDDANGYEKLPKKDKDKVAAKVDFMRAITAICNRKDYNFMEMRAEGKKDDGGISRISQIVEIPVPVETALDRRARKKCGGKFSSVIAKKAAEKEAEKKTNPQLQINNATFDMKKRANLNFIRQKLRKKLYEIKLENWPRKRNDARA